MKLHKTMARPLLAYGSEVQTVTENRRSKIEVDKMNFLRSVVGIRKKTKTETKISERNYRLIIF
jgi:hypothetical protein